MALAEMPDVLEVNYSGVRMVSAFKSAFLISALTTTSMIH
jgi:hypothetical protein